MAATDPDGNERRRNTQCSSVLSPERICGKTEKLLTVIENRDEERRSIQAKIFTCQIEIYFYRDCLKAGFHSGKYCKHPIGSDWTFFHLVLDVSPDQKKLKILQLFIIRVADHRFKLEQKISTESLCAGSILFRFGPNPCLFS